MALLAKERGLPFLEVEVTYPFEPAGPLRVRIEAFLETLLLDPDLLDPDLLDPDLGDPEGDPDLGDPEAHSDGDRDGDPEGDPDDPNADGDFFDDNGRGAAARKHVRSAEAETGPWQT
ncbi:MAG: 2-hydroxyacyl-CoA dehydratase family protein [Actinobacteria bacterium]|nr:2-hydroxyacyl-CoA dehydratase family protein [Actinomycetota bacterium]